MVFFQMLEMLKQSWYYGENGASESLQMDVTEDGIGKELYHINRFSA